MLKMTLSAIALSVLSATSTAATMTIDATDADEFAYVNLSSGQETNANGTWHVAFSKTKVKINDPLNGNGNVKAALAATPSAFYSNGQANQSRFVNATPSSESGVYNSITSGNGLNYVQSVPTPAIKTNDWLSNGRINSQNWWVVRSSDGTDQGSASSGRRFAKFHVTQLSSNSVTLEYAWHSNPNGNSFGSLKSISATVNNAGTCIDFDGRKPFWGSYPGTARTVACTDSTWDLKLTKKNGQFQLWTNSGVENAGSGLGKALGPIDNAKALAMTNGKQDANTGRDITSYYKADSVEASLFTTNKWYHYTAFNTSGGASMHSVYSNYRVFVIRDAAKGKDYKLQIMSYYNGTPSMFNGTAGTITFRYDALN